jgi:hypothetical protein
MKIMHKWKDLKRTSSCNPEVNESIPGSASNTNVRFISTYNINTSVIIISGLRPPIHRNCAFSDEGYVIPWFPFGQHETPYTK